MNLQAHDSLAEDRLSMSLKLVLAVLRERGEISVADIEAIPLVQDSDDVEIILHHLLRHEAVEIVQRKVSGYPIMRWERVVQQK